MLWLTRSPMDWSLSIFSWKAFPTGIGPSVKTNALRTSPFFLHAVRPSLLSAMLLPRHVWNLLYLASLSAVLSASMILKPSPTTSTCPSADSERRGVQVTGPLRIHGEIPDYITYYHRGYYTKVFVSQYFWDELSLLRVQWPLLVQLSAGVNISWSSNHPFLDNVVAVTGSVAAFFANTKTLFTCLLE